MKPKRAAICLCMAGNTRDLIPSVMIWRAEISEEKQIIVDMQYEDRWIVEHVWREWLMPEETDDEYIPPNQFLVMLRE